MNRKVFSMSMVIFVLGFMTNSYADRISYVWTYEYMTMYKGRMEAEYYYTLKVPETSEFDINTMSHQLELEYGITDR